MDRAGRLRGTDQVARRRATEYGLAAHGSMQIGATGRAVRQAFASLRALHQVFESLRADDRFTDHAFVFRLLLLYRWLALAVPAVALLAPSTPEPPMVGGWPLLLVAVVDNLAPSLFPRGLNGLVLRFPALFAVDLLLGVALVGASGGVYSPYFLYAMSPILACAFFFGVRGALRSALAYAPLYVFAVLVGTPEPRLYLPPLLAGQLLALAGAGVAFGFLAEMLQRLRSAAADLQRARDGLIAQNARLGRANQELRAIHDLGAVIRDATTVDQVQERVLSVLATQFGFERVIVGLVDPGGQVVTSWLVAGDTERAAALTHTARVEIGGGDSGVARALASGKALHMRAEELPPLPASLIGSQAGQLEYAVLPMICRQRPVGVIVLDNPRTDRGIPLEALDSLSRLGTQAALAVANVQMCVERAQRIAVMSERQRIAADMHDAAIQSLFGMALSLHGCLKVIERDPPQIRERLHELHALALQTLATVRGAVYDLWEEGFDGRRLVAALRRQADELQRAGGLAVGVEVRGDPTTLDETTAKILYRIAQEALSNAARHARARQATLTLELAGGCATLTVADTGCGFDPSAAGSGLGLRTMRERATAAGGQLDVHSALGKGTTVTVLLRCRQ